MQLQHFTGTDVPIPELRLTLHQPTLKELSYLGTDNDIFSAIRFLILEKDKYFQGVQGNLQITNFQVFSTILQESNAKELKSTVFSLLMILFPNYSFMFSPSGGLIATNIEENITVLIDDNNFPVLQQKCKECFRTDKLFANEQEYNPVNKKAQEIADKIKQGRARVAAQKANLGEESQIARYVSILSVGLKLSPLEITQWTLPTLFEIFERFNLNLAWNIDLQVRTAGGSPNKAAEDWTKEL